MERAHQMQRLPPPRSTTNIQRQPLWRRVPDDFFPRWSCDSRVFIGAVGHQGCGIAFDAMSGSNARAEGQGECSVSWNLAHREGEGISTREVGRVSGYGDVEEGYHSGGCGGDIHFRGEE